jgi:hypothetical protein
MSGAATLQFPVVSLIGGGSVNGLDVKICSVQLDPDCDMPLPGSWSYDKDTSLLTVTVPKQKTLVRLLLTAPDMAVAEWYSQRAIIGETVESGPTILVPPNTGDLLGASFDPPIAVDMDTKATLLARVYNCKGEAAVGVTLNIGTQFDETRIFYTDESNQVLLDKLETGTPGTAGAVNVKPQSTRVTLLREGAMISRFDVTPRPKVITYLQLYPFVY